MPSSTSSSESATAAVRWSAFLAGGVALAALFVAAMELRLAAKGFRATVEDNSALWVQQRRRASGLGERALLLVGASRMQLDLDLATLERGTGLEPVQLAIDGSSFLPVLEGLARDPAVRGTVLVSYMDHVIAEPRREDRASEWQQLYEHDGEARGNVADRIEQSLSAFVSNRLRSYADGARPISSLLLRILPSRPTRQYLATLPDRSRLADYRLVSMPAFYYGRVLRNLGEEIDTAGLGSWQELDRVLEARVAALPVADGAGFRAGIDRIANWVSVIEARGGRVIFLRLPSSGWVHAIEARRYPRDRFWDVFRQTLSRPAVHFEDVPELRRFECPDGSHLDYRDRSAFTAALLQALRNQLPPP